jgi:hypothetical protein
MNATTHNNGENAMTNEYTISDNIKNVKVSELRNLTDQLMRIVNFDSKQCVGNPEKSACVETARRIGSELMGTVSLRAKKSDWDRRERALDMSFNYISNSVM